MSGDMYDIDGSPGTLDENGQAWATIASDMREEDSERYLDIAIRLLSATLERVEDDADAKECCEEAIEHAKATQIILQGPAEIEEEAETCPECGSPAWGIYRQRGTGKTCLDCGTRKTDESNHV